MGIGVVGVSVLAVAGCGRLDFDPLAGVGDDISGDASNDAATDVATSCATTPWGNFVHHAALASGSDDWEPTLSPDGLHIVFSSDRTGSFRLYYASRTDVNGEFGTPTILSAVGAGDVTYAPQWSRDGNVLYWHHHGNDFIFHYARIGITGVDSLTLSLDLASRTEIGQTLDRDETFLLADQREVFYTVGEVNRKDVGWSVKPSAADPFSSYAQQTLPASFNGTVPSFDDGWPTFDETRQELWWERDDGSAGSTQPGSRILSATRAGDGMPFDATIHEHPELGEGSDPDLDADGLAIAISADETGPPAGLPNSGRSDIYTATRTCQ